MSCHSCGRAPKHGHGRRQLWPHVRRMRCSSTRSGTGHLVAVGTEPDRCTSQAVHVVFDMAHVWVVPSLGPPFQGTDPGGERRDRWPCPGQHLGLRRRSVGANPRVGEQDRGGTSGVVRVLGRGPSGGAALPLRQRSCGLQALPQPTEGLGRLRCHGGDQDAHRPRGCPGASGRLPRAHDVPSEGPPCASDWLRPDATGRQPPRVGRVRRTTRPSGRACHPR